MFERDDLAALIQVLMAAAGALARNLNRRSESALKVGHVLSDLFVAAFTGMLLYWVSRAWGLDEGWVYALAGLAGWVGPKAIDALAGIISSKAGIKLDDGEKRESDGN